MWAEFGEPDIDIREERQGDSRAQGLGRLRPDHRPAPQFVNRRHRPLASAAKKPHSTKGRVHTGGAGIDHTAPLTDVIR